MRRGPRLQLQLPASRRQRLVGLEPGSGCRLRQIAAYAPDALIVSLGVDTFKEDPISQFRLDSPDYTRMGEIIGRLGLQTLFVMEGGYAVEEIGINAINVLQGFDSTVR